MEDIVVRASSFFSFLTDKIPYPFYLTVEKGGVGNDESSDMLWAESSKSMTKKSKKADRRKSRYDVSSWKSTTTHLKKHTFSSKSKSQRTHQPTRSDKKVSHSTTSSGSQQNVTNKQGLSRDELLKRLHAKIESLKAQNQSKKSLSSTESAEKRTLSTLKSSKKQLPVRNDSIPTQFDLNKIIGETEDSSENRVLTKKRRLEDAIRQAEKKEKRRSEWSSEKIAHVEDQEMREKAVVRAAGGRVYDDVKRLKKAIKVRKVKKLKSNEAQAKRTESLKESQKERQEKRNKNIIERQERKKSKTKR